MEGHWGWIVKDDEENYPMAFKFTMIKDVAIPETVRGGGGRSLGFPFDELKPGKVGETVKGNAGFYVPKQFWIDEADLKSEDVGQEKGKGSPTDLKDRIRRSFYGWRDQEEHAAKRKNLTLTFVDDYDPTSKAYKGVNVYLTVGDGATSSTKPKSKAA